MPWIKNLKENKSFKFNDPKHFHKSSMKVWLLENFLTNTYWKGVTIWFKSEKVNIIASSPLYVEYETRIVDESGKKVEKILAKDFFRKDTGSEGLTESATTTANDFWGITSSTGELLVVLVI